MQTTDASSREPETAVLVCFAVKEEANAFRRKSADLANVRILITGIGKQNAARALRDCLGDCHPGLVLSSGFAGGLNPDLKSGEVVFLTAAESPRDRLLAVGARPARFECASRILTTAGEKRELRRSTGADAVEMESEALQDICREKGIPCATVRVILDSATEDLPLDFNLLSKPDLSVAYGKLAWAIAKSPGKIGALLKLQKQAAAAAEKLGDVLVRVVAG